MTAGSSKVQEVNTAYMLFGVVIVYLICQCVPVTHATLRCATGDVGTDAYVPYVECLMSFFFVLNASINFVIYCVSGKQFRKIFIKMVCS